MSAGAMHKVVGVAVGGATDSAGAGMGCAEFASSARAPVALVVLVDIAAGARLWGYSRFLLARFALARAPGMLFFKMLGSGHDGGFGLKPSASRQGMFCVLRDDAACDAFLADNRVLAGYRSHAVEFFSLRLRTASVRGS